MPNKKQVHVVPNSKKGGWDVKSAGSKKAVKNHSTKDKAVSHGRQVSKNKSGELVIHKKDGSIQKRDSHGKDPYPPKG